MVTESAVGRGMCRGRRGGSLPDAFSHPGTGHSRPDRRHWANVYGGTFRLHVSTTPRPSDLSVPMVPDASSDARVTFSDAASATVGSPVAGTSAAISHGPSARVRGPGIGVRAELERRNCGQCFSGSARAFPAVPQSSGPQSFAVDRSVFAKPPMKTRIDLPRRGCHHTSREESGIMGPAKSSCRFPGHFRRGRAALPPGDAQANAVPEPSGLEVTIPDGPPHKWRRTPKWKKWTSRLP